jgi:hypothetical protein
MRKINTKKIAVIYGAAKDEFSYNIIKETSQFPTYYHKGKKKLINNECDYIVFVPKAGVNIDSMFFAKLDKVSKINSYNTIDDVWNWVTQHKPDEQWSHLVKLSKVYRFSKNDITNRFGINLKGIQGGIRYIDTPYNL